MNYNNLAPIVLFAYKRLDVIKATILFLQRNFLSEKSILFIYSDGPKNPEDEAEVINLRKYIKKIEGFKEVYIIERENNYGLSKNIIEGVTEVINTYGKVIVLEDDLITSKNFLIFMNQALDFYEHNEQIFSISGYTKNLPSLKKLEYDIYFSYRPSSWGWATWKDRWENLDWTIKDFDNFIKNKNEIKKFNRGGRDMTKMLKHYMIGKNNSWAIRWAYNMFKENKFCVYPKISKIQNIGFGESATHCKGINIYKTILDNSNQIKFNFLKQIYLDSQVIKEFRNIYSYKNKFSKKMQYYIERLLK